MAIHHQIAIIGAGTAGITVAAQLRRKDSALDIVIIDPADKHYYQPAWTLVGAGTYKMEATERDMADLIPDGVKWMQDAVTEMLPDTNTLKLQSGEDVTYDYLVACPGIQIDRDGIEGLADVLDKNDVCSNYTDPEYTWEVLQNFKGGTAIFTQPATAIKCGGAPQKIMYLADEYFRRQGVRDKTHISFITPGSVIFGVEPFKSTLMEIVDRKDLELRFFHKLIKVDGPNKRAVFEITNHVDDPEKLYHNRKDLPGLEMLSDNTVSIPYDIMHLAPPQSSPDFVKRSKIAHQEGPSKGWIDVNPYSLQHNQYPNVFALGDAAALPTAKTGAAIRKQAPVLVENLLHVMHQDGQIEEGYHGYSSCPLVTGYGKMLLAEFNYEGERDSDPAISRFVDTSKEQWSMWILKKYGLPFLYWNLMLKGRA